MLESQVILLAEDDLEDGDEDEGVGDTEDAGDEGSDDGDADDEGDDDM